MLTALERAAPGTGAAGLELLGAGQPIEAVLAAVLNELSVLPDDVDLVLDDYHLAESPEIQPGVAFLLERLPPQVRLVISTRADPALPLPRLRARGELTEVRAADLRFTHEEASTLPRRGDRARAGHERRRRAPGPDRGLDRIAAARRDLAAGPGRPLALHRGVRRRRPVRRGLPRRGGPRPAAAGRPRLPARHGDPRPAHRTALRRRHGDDRAAARCWSRWSAATCSWCLSTTSAAGTATTTCSPTSSVHTCSARSPTEPRGCTAGPPRGSTTPASRSRPSGTRSRPATSSGRPSWSSSRSRRCASSAARP